MSDNCAWPDCYNEYTILYHTGKKPIGLCDKHNKVVTHERSHVMSRARLVVGLPMPKMLGRMLRGVEEKGSRCCVLGCYSPAILVVGDEADEKPLCSAHIGEDLCDLEGLSFEKETWQPFTPGCKATPANANRVDKADKADKAIDYGNLFDTDLYFD